MEQATNQVTESDIDWAFRLYFGRELDNPETAKRLLRNFKTLGQLRRHMLNQREFSLPGAAVRRRNLKVTEPMIAAGKRLVLLNRPPGRDMDWARSNNADELLATLLAHSGHKSNHKDVAIILNKSMPRSGHHFLVRMLREYFSTDLHYCGFYRQEGCCESIPCTKPRPDGCINRFFMQKSHDLKLDDPVLKDYKYIIQYRHPIPRSQSNFELAIRRGRPLLDNKLSFSRFVRRESRYFIKFYNKWIAHPPPRSLVLSYETLLQDTERVLTRVVAFISDEGVHAERIADAVATLEGRKADTGKPFAPREMEAYRYYDPKLYRKLEEQIFKACPGLDLPRHFTDPRT